MSKHKLHIRYIGTWSPSEKKFRLFRLLWASGANATEKGWHSDSFSVSLCPKCFSKESEFGGWALTILGLRLHKQKSWSSWIV